MSRCMILPSEYTSERVQNIGPWSALTAFAQGDLTCNHAKMSTFKTFVHFVDQIAFSVYNSQHLTMRRNTPTNVVYDAVYYNYKNVYNPVSGIFKAPSPGLYVFTWSSLVAPRKIFDAEILVNGNRKGLGNCNNERSSGWENCANTVPLVLETGDKVNIRTVVANDLSGGGWSSFKGWRVN